MSTCALFTFSIPLELPDGNLDVSKPNLRYREDSEGLSQALQTTRLVFKADLYTKLKIEANVTY